MKHRITTREVTIGGQRIPAGTLVLASYNAPTDRTVVLVPGVGHRAFQVSPVGGDL